MADHEPDDEPTRTAFHGETGLPRPAAGDSALAAFDPFVDIDPALRRSLEALVRPATFAAGAHVMRQGAPGDSLMLVLEGEADVVVEDGATRHLLRRAGPGAILGEMALLTHEPRTANVVALTPLRALVLSAEDFHRLAHEEPSISVVLTRLLASRLGQGTHDALAGKNLGGFAIRRRLGRGGMALVYEADDPAAGRRVALKMMSHRLVYNRAAEEQFQREADIVEAFDHPNVARMFGRFAAFHTYFIVMEYCDGLSLDRILGARRRLSEDEARRILGQLALALDYAHRAGIVHRDIKPSNVIVNRDGVVKLMDFGLARQALAAAEPRGLWGTPIYMAPEQLRREPAGPEADIFALGLVGFEMLAGRRLFDAQGLDALVDQHASWRIPDLEEACPHLDAGTRAILSGCLDRDPARRRLDPAVVGGWGLSVDYRALVGGPFGGT